MTRQHIMLLMLPLLAVSTVTMHAQAGDGEEAARAAEREVAIADIVGCRGEGMLGRAILTEQVTDEGIKIVIVNIRVDGLPAGRHGVHIHETGSCEPCGSAGGHFDPGPDGNPNPDGNHPYHSGDLVNLTVNDEGLGQLSTITTRVTLSPGPLSVFDNDGSAFIIHDNEDTFCPDGAVAGCAGGSRAACGIIRSF